MTIQELFHRQPAEAADWAVLTYSERAAFFFNREDRAKRRGDRDSARVYHDMGVLVGHAARLEMVDPPVLGE